MITEQELIKAKLAARTDLSASQIIRDLIIEHERDERIELMRQGVQYYQTENAILERRRTYYDRETGKYIHDKTATDNRIPHSWHKLLVDQKASYVAGEQPVIAAEPEAWQQALNTLLGERFFDELPEMVVQVSNKGREWMHPYIDAEGELRWVMIDARQVIPIYDTSLEQELTDVLRYYRVIVNGEKRRRVEWWTPEEVTYYIEIREGVWELDTTMDEEPVQPHFTRNGEPSSWGRAPFIKFANNRDEFPDLKQYKELIDLYDLVVSDFGNDLEDIQEAVWVLKNYGGESLAEFQRNLRWYKAIKVDGDGGADPKRIEIPVEAKEKLLDRTEENIFLFGQGANLKTDRFGNSPSGVALQFLYAMLDMKSDFLITKFKRAIREFAWFAAEYLRLVGRGDHDPEPVAVTFNKTMIFNEAERIESVGKSRGIVSDETALANHPWVDDVEKEMKKVEQEREDRVDLDALEDEESDKEDDEE